MVASYLGAAPLTSGESTARAVIGKFGKEWKGRGEYRFNSPFRENADSNSFVVKITDDEHGAFHDHVSGDKGSLYDLAEWLGIETPRSLASRADSRPPLRAVTTGKGSKQQPPSEPPDDFDEEPPKQPKPSKRSYSGLADYAMSHGVPPEVFTSAGWSETTWDNRPALKFTTATGPRVRFLDGKKPPFGHAKGYKSCWYELTRAVELAKTTGFIALPNGEASVVVAQHHGIAACCITTGSERKIPFELLKKFQVAFPSGRIAVVADRDQQGRDKTPELAAQLRAVGYDARIVDFGPGDDGFDLADHCKEHGTESATRLREMFDAAKPTEKPTEDSQEKSSRLLTRCVADIQPSTVRWLWHDRIPLGALTMLSGPEGEGKTRLHLSIAAAVSRGLPLHLGDAAPTVSGTILLCASEDSPEFMVRPVLEKMGADLSRIHICDQPFGLDVEGVVRLDSTLAELRPVLVVFDALFDYVPPRHDMNKDSDVRAMTRGLRELAAKHGCAIVCVRHIGKSKGSGDVRAAGLGGIGFRAAARSELLVGANPENPSERAVIVTKSNLTNRYNVPAVGFTFDEAGEFRWTGASDVTAEMILAPVHQNDGEGETHARHEAEDFLQEALADGPRPITEVKQDAREAGISDKVLRTAGKRLKVSKKKVGGEFGGRGAKWVWSLPDAQDAHQDDKMPKMPTPENRASCEETGILWENGRTETEAADAERF